MVKELVATESGRGRARPNTTQPSSEKAERLGIEGSGTMKPLHTSRGNNTGNNTRTTQNRLNTLHKAITQEKEGLHANS